MSKSRTAFLTDGYHAVERRSKMADYLEDSNDDLIAELEADLKREYAARIYAEKLLANEPCTIESHKQLEAENKRLRKLLEPNPEIEKLNAELDALLDDIYDLKKFVVLSSDERLKIAVETSEKYITFMSDEDAALIKAALRQEGV